MFFLQPNRVSRVLRAAPTLLDSSGNPVRLSDSANVNLLYGQTYASLKQISTSCTAILETNFPELKKKYDWFDELNENFLLTKELARTWLKDYSTPILVSIPNSVIDFAPDFQYHAETIRDIIAHETLSKRDKADIKSHLEKLIKKVEEIQANVGQYVDRNGEKGKLIDWRNKILDAHDKLSSKTPTIRTAIQNLEDDIPYYSKIYETRIDELRKEIQEYNKGVSLGAALVGVGATVAGVGIGLCFVFAPLGGIVIGIGAVMLIGGSVVWGVYQKKINNCNNEIKRLRDIIDTDKQALAALPTISTAVQDVVQQSDIACQNMSDFVVSWAMFGERLKNIYDKFEEATSGDLEDIREALFVSEKNWQQVLEYVNGLSGIGTGVKVISADEQVA